MKMPRPWSGLTLSRGRMGWRTLLVATVLLTAVAAHRRRAEFPFRVVTGQYALWRMRVDTMESGATGGGLAFLFLPLECSQGMQVVERLNAIHRAGQVAVRAYLIGTPASIPQWRDFARIQGIEFDLVLLDPVEASVVAATLGYDATPAFVLFERAGKHSLISEERIQSLALRAGDP